MRRGIFIRASVLLLLLGIPVIAAWAWGRQDPVSRRIAERVASHDGRQIDLGEIADFDWDRVYCFDCYSGQSQIEKRLGFPWPGLGGSAIESSDGVCLIVFVKDGRVVRSFDHPRKDGDFGGIDNPQGLTKRAARFAVHYPGGGNPPYLTLAANR